MSHVVIIDPARHTPEVECYNRIALASPLRATYHLPSMYGMQSLRAESLSTVKGIVVLGSAASVNERAPWQLALEEWLRPLMDRGLPTLGICYGHQMIARMYGGSVDYLSLERTKLVGLRQIELDATPAWPAATGALVVSHCEIVIVPPPDFRVSARSPEVAVDGLTHKTLPIITLQAHPEAVPEFLANRELPVSSTASLAFGNGLVDRFLAFLA